MDLWQRIVTTTTTFLTSTAATPRWYSLQEVQQLTMLGFSKRKSEYHYTLSTSVEVTFSLAISCATYLLLMPRKEAGRTVCSVTPKRECWDFNTCTSAITLMVTLSEVSPVVLLFRVGGTLDPIDGNSRSDLLILATLVEPWVGKQISRLDKVL